MAQQIALKEDQGLKHQPKLVMQQLSCVEKLALKGCRDATLAGLRHLGAFKRLVFPWEAKMQRSWYYWVTGLATAFITLSLWKSVLH